MSEWGSQWRVNRETIQKTQDQIDYERNRASLDLTNLAKLKEREPSALRFVSDSLRLWCFGFGVLMLSVLALQFSPEGVPWQLWYLPLCLGVGYLISVLMALWTDIDHYSKDRDAAREPKKPPLTLYNQTVIKQSDKSEPEPTPVKPFDADYWQERFIIWCYEYAEAHNLKMPSEREAQAARQFDGMPTDKWLSELAERGVSEGRQSDGFKKSGTWRQGLTIRNALIMMGYDVTEPGKPSRTATEMLCDANTK